MKRLKKKLKFLLCLALVAGTVLSVSTAAFAEEKAPATAPAIKNVILLIPDGASVGGTTLARWYKGGSLALDEMASGLVRTYSSDAAIADSAPAGTAFATGFKSHTGYVGVLPDKADMPGLAPIAKGDEKKPVATILEAAKLAGKSTGIIATSEIMHATPADFTSHFPNRGNYDVLSKQQVYQGVDVVLGGGSKFFAAENRKDKNDLLSEIKKQGYDYFTTPEAFKASTSSKIWGLFAPAAMTYELDRNPAKEPSLAEMTAKAIEVLSKNDKGFFLMVEGSKVDWAAHANDPVGVVTDLIAFDDAVKVALDFAKNSKNTAVISVTDHGNGGITIGNKDTDKTYDKEPLSTFLTALKKAKLTGEGLETKFNADKSNVKEVMEQYFGITDLTDDEVKAIVNTKAGSMNYTVGPMISKRARLGWTTGGHTGEDVPLYTYAPNNDRLTGVVENTDIAKYMARVLGLDLNETTKKLFVSAREAFEAKGATVEWDNTDDNNPVVVVKKGTDVLRLSVSTNVAELNGAPVKVMGVTVFNGVKTYVPQDAVELIK